MYGDYELKHLAESFERMVREGTLKGVVPLEESSVVEASKPGEADAIAAFLAKKGATKLAPANKETVADSQKRYWREVKKANASGETPAEMKKRLAKEREDEEGHSTAYNNSDNDPRSRFMRDWENGNTRRYRGGEPDHRDGVQDRDESVELADRLEALAEGLEALQGFARLVETGPTKAANKKSARRYRASLGSSKKGRPHAFVTGYWDKTSNDNYDTYSGGPDLGHIGVRRAFQKDQSKKGRAAAEKDPHYQGPKNLAPYDGHRDELSGRGGRYADAADSKKRDQQFLRDNPEYAAQREKEDAENPEYRRNRFYSRRLS